MKTITLWILFLSFSAMAQVKDMRITHPDSAPTFRAVMAWNIAYNSCRAAARDLSATAQFSTSSFLASKGEGTLGDWSSKQIGVFIESCESQVEKCLDSDNANKLDLNPRLSRAAWKKEEWCKGARIAFRDQPGNYFECARVLAHKILPKLKQAKVKPDDVQDYINSSADCRDASLQRIRRTGDATRWNEYSTEFDGQIIDGLATGLVKPIRSDGELVEMPNTMGE